MHKVNPDMPFHIDHRPAASFICFSTNSEVFIPKTEAVNQGPSPTKDAQGTALTIHLVVLPCVLCRPLTLSSLALSFAGSKTSVEDKDSEDVMIPE